MGLYFDASYFPGLGSYQTAADTSWWTEDPTIISGMNDTLIEVQPDAVVPTVIPLILLMIMDVHLTRQFLLL